MRFYTILACIAFCGSLAQGAKKEVVQDFPQDKNPEEVLEDVKQTRQELLYKVAGIKIKKPKDPREGFYGLVSIGAAFTPSLGTSSVLGVEVGYDFIFGKRHSLRIFGFFDRTNYGGFADLEFDNSKPNAMQIYRGGFSAEYRIYANSYIGFRIRLGSLGAFNFSRTDSAIIPTLTAEHKKWFFSTIAFGPIFTYGRHHELFVGYDLLDYQKERGMSVNYLKYSYKF